LESGEHDELILRKGPYYNLLQKHLGREPTKEGLSWFPDEDPDIVPLVESPQSAKVAANDPPSRSETGRTIVKWISTRAWRELGKMNANTAVPPQEQGLCHLARRIASFTGGNQRKYAYGFFFALRACSSSPSTILIDLVCLVSGGVYPAVGVVYAKGLDILSLDDRREIRRGGNLSALWCVSFGTMGFLPTDSGFEG